MGWSFVGNVVIHGTEVCRVPHRAPAVYADPAGHPLRLSELGQ